MVEVTAGGRTLRRRVYAGEGYLGGSSRRLHFGLADAAEIDSVRVFWPDGVEEELASVKPGHLHRIVQGVGSGMPLETAATSPFDGRPPAHITSNGESETRVPVLDKLPYASLSLPTFEGEPKTVRDFAGLPLLVYVWGSWEEHATDGLTKIADAMGALRGVEVFPLSIDGVREDEATQYFLSKSGLAERGGRAVLAGRIGTGTHGGIAQAEGRSALPDHDAGIANGQCALAERAGTD
ncbi:MAG: ASPIC/UnbV domain-containing protein, partial [Candidatus Poseidoniia archaeon]